jgi:inner membrane protein
MALAALPDADALFLGVIPYDHPLGHRGLTHSLFFAAMIGLLVASLFSKAGWAPEHSFWSLAIIFSLVTASHGFFDAMTDGGLGIAFFAPFANTRYFFPWRPIPVAPLSIGYLASPGGLRVIRWEAALFWTLTAGALIWDRESTWRMALTALFALLGTTMWILALNENG